MSVQTTHTRQSSPIIECVAPGGLGQSLGISKGAKNSSLFPQPLQLLESDLAGNIVSKIFDLLGGGNGNAAVTAPKRNLSNQDTEEPIRFFRRRINSDCRLPIIFRAARVETGELEPNENGTFRHLPIG